MEKRNCGCSACKMRNEEDFQAIVSNLDMNVEFPQESNSASIAERINEYGYSQEDLNLLSFLAMLDTVEFVEFSEYPEFQPYDWQEEIAWEDEWQV